MPIVSFTTHLRRHIDAPAEKVTGATVHEALENYFERHPKVRPYLFDEQGILRKHVTIFVGDTQAHDRDRLSDPIVEGQDIYILQALSGG